MNLKTSVLKKLADAPDERYAFRADSLKISDADFQHVVGIVLEAKALGFIAAITEPHRSSQSGLYDLIVAEGLTEAGKEALRKGWS